MLHNIGVFFFWFLRQMEFVLFNYQKTQKATKTRIKSGTSLWGSRGETRQPQEG